MQFKRRPSRRFLFWAVALEAACQGLREPAPMELLLIGAASLLAGLADAVGGGGLILVPALFAILPNTHPATLFGITKSASIWGTGLALHAGQEAARQHHAPRLGRRAETLAASAIGLALGFYDGFFGPGTHHQ